jgi:hypothetical protein
VKNLEGSITQRRRGYGEDQSRAARSLGFVWNVTIMRNSSSEAID